MALFKTAFAPFQLQTRLKCTFSNKNINGSLIFAPLQFRPKGDSMLKNRSFFWLKLMRSFREPYVNGVASIQVELKKVFEALLETSKVAFQCIYDYSLAAGVEAYQNRGRNYKLQCFRQLWDLVTETLLVPRRFLMYTKIDAKKALTTMYSFSMTTNLLLNTKNPGKTIISGKITEALDKGRALIGKKK